MTPQESQIPEAYTLAFLRQITERSAAPDDPIVRPWRTRDAAGERERHLVETR